MTEMAEDKKVLWNFRLIDVMAVIIIGLVGWNLRETIALKQQAAVLQGAQNILQLRVDILESEKNKGGRFTSSDGQILLKDIQHNRDMILQHIKRTEPKIDKMYESLQELNGKHNGRNIN